MVVPLCRSPLFFLAPFFLFSLFSVPFAFADDDSSAGPPMNKTVVEDFETNEQKYYENLGEKTDDQCDVNYDPKNGKCAWWNEDKQMYEHPALEYDSLDDLQCLPDLHNRIFTHVCGEKLYEQVKYCAKVKFFNNKEPAKGAIPENRQNVLLLLVDGCILCITDTVGSEESLITVTLQLSYTQPAGSFFTYCFEEPKQLDYFEMSFAYNATPLTTQKIVGGGKKIETDGGLSHDSVLAQYAFAFPTLMIERECHGLLADDDFNGGYKDVTLTVHHNCGVKKKPIVQLLTNWLQTNSFKSNVAELRRLYIDLEEESVKQFSALSRKYVIEKTMEFENFKIPEDDVF